jgi:hypothetical protein
MSLHKDYATAESYVNGEYDLRIQKIGNHYRAYKRVPITGWKANSKDEIIEDIPVTEKFKTWADECSKLFGGMDILGKRLFFPHFLFFSIGNSFPFFFIFNDFSQIFLFSPFFASIGRNSFG